MFWEARRGAAGPTGLPAMLTLVSGVGAVHVLEPLDRGLSGVPHCCCPNLLPRK